MKIGRWLTIIKCGTWHWRPVVQFYSGYMGFDWGYWVVYVGAGVQEEFEAAAIEEADFYEDQRRL